MSKSLRLPGQRQVSPQQHGARPMAPVLTVRPHAAVSGCFNCGGFTSVVIRHGNQTFTVDCPVCTAGVSQ